MSPDAGPLACFQLPVAFTAFRLIKNWPLVELHRWRPKEMLTMSYIERPCAERKHAKIGPANLTQNFGGWPERIAAKWRASVESVIAAGNLIIEAKVALAHGEFESMIDGALPFGASTARRLMAIAQDPRISNRAHVHVLPAAWGTLYELTKLDDDQFSARIADGTIRPDLERAEVTALRKAAARAPSQVAYAERVAIGCTLADLNALADSGARFAAILADPNWKYETWSAKGKDRSPDRHYETDPLAEIKALPIKRLAAVDSVLHLWCMDWLLPAALELIEEWGFRFIKVGFVWVKQNPSGDGLFMGLGKWTRAGTELCLFATRGDPSRLNGDVRQVIEEPIREHSRKPNDIHARIERLSAGPYLELYARRPREGWTVWGDEIPRASFTFVVDDNDVDPIEAPRTDDGLNIPNFLRRGHPECVIGVRGLGIGGVSRETGRTELRR